MPLQKLNALNLPKLSDTDLINIINSVIDQANDLEARLSVLEHPVESLSEETAPKCNCMMVNDKRVCPQHDVVITNDHKC